MSENVSTTECSGYVRALLQRAADLESDSRLCEARVAYQAAIDADSACVARNEFGRFLVRIEQYAEALAQFTIVLDAAKTRGNSRLRAAACNNLAVVYREIGRFAVAARFQQRSISAENAGGAASIVEKSSACDLANRANDAVRDGQFELAQDLFSRSLRLEVESGNLEGEAADWASLGVVKGLKGDPAEGLVLLWRGYRLHHRLADHRGAGCDLVNLAELYRRLGRWAKTVRCLKCALERFRSAGALQMAERTSLLLQETMRIAEVAQHDPLLN